MRKCISQEMAQFHPYDNNEHGDLLGSMQYILTLWTGIFIQGKGQGQETHPLGRNEIVQFP